LSRNYRYRATKSKKIWPKKCKIFLEINKANSSKKYKIKFNGEVKKKLDWRRRRLITKTLRKSTPSKCRKQS
jgi:hypothetical protein